MPNGDLLLGGALQCRKSRRISIQLDDSILIVSFSNTAVSIGNRLLAPVYSSLIFLLFVAVEQLSPLLNHVERENHAKLWFGSGLLLLLTGILFNERVIAVFYLPAIGLAATSIRLMVLSMEVTFLVMGVFLIAFRARMWSGFLPAGLCALWLMTALPSAYDLTLDRTINGAGGYNTVSWQKSSLIEWLRRNPLEGTVYSNNPRAVYILGCLLRSVPD